MKCKTCNANVQGKFYKNMCMWCMDITCKSCIQKMIVPGEYLGDFEYPYCKKCETEVLNRAQEVKKENEM